MFPCNITVWRRCHKKTQVAAVSSVSRAASWGTHGSVGVFPASVAALDHWGDEVFRPRLETCCWKCVSVRTFANYHKTQSTDFGNANSFAGFLAIKP